MITIRYSRGAKDQTRATIQITEAVAAAINGGQGVCRVAVDYDEDTRECFVSPSPDGRGTITKTGLTDATPWRINPPYAVPFPKSGAIDIAAELIGDILQFTIPQELPEPREVNRTPAAHAMTPDEAVDAIRAILDRFPNHVLKALIPGQGMRAIRPEILRMEARDA